MKHAQNAHEVQCFVWNGGHGLAVLVRDGGGKHGGACGQSGCVRRRALRLSRCALVLLRLPRQLKAIDERRTVVLCLVQCPLNAGRAACQYVSTA